MMARPHLLGLLEDAARWGEQTALSRRQGLRLERWSWGRLRRGAARVSRHLEESGVGHGDRVILRASEGPEWVAAFWGCLLRGATAVPLDVESPPGFVERVAGQVEPATTVDDVFLRERAALGEDHAAPALPPPGLDRDDLAEIVFTSGTTSEPKGVCLTHRNLVAAIAPLEEEIERRRGLARLVRPLRFLVPLPLTHVYGQISAVFIPPLLGAEVHFPHSLKARELVESARRHRISVMPCVPRQLEILREHVEWEARRRGRGAALTRDLARADGWSWPRRWWAFRFVHRLFGWRFWVFATGGAALSQETEIFWRRLGYVVVQGYGMTETAALATINDPFRSTRGSIGGPLPGQELRVDTDGQILVRGDAVSPGYWEGGVRPLADRDGWLRTGDLAEQDPSGVLFFRGRAGDVIVTAAGQNIHPEDLERALVHQPEVRAASVVAVDGGAGPEPVAILILKEGSRDRAADVLARANEALGPQQRMRHVFVWPDPDFPRTPGTQKVKKGVLTEWARALRSGTGEGKDASHPLAPMIAGAGGEVPGDLDASLKLSTDLKLDSLGQLEFLSAVEERYQVDIDESLITPSTTLGEIEAFLSDPSRPVDRVYPYPRWAQRPWARGLRSLLHALVVLPIARVLCWTRVRGVEHLRDLEGPALFVCNHVSMVDAGLIVSALPWRLRHRLAIAMDGEILRDWRHPPPRASRLRRMWGPPLYAATALLFGVFPLPKKSGFRRSFAFAGSAVDDGQSLLVFPEGERTTDGAMAPFRSGIGLLAAGLRVPVVPLRILGLFELKRRRRYVAWPAEVAIIFGAPARYRDDAEPPWITADLEGRVAGLSSG